MSFQFVHMQGFSRKGDQKGRSTAYVFAEARRDPAASLHVTNPLPPAILFGVDIEQVERMHDAAAEVARTVPKAGKPRKVRTDQQTLMTIVASHPHLVRDVLNDARKQSEVSLWERLTMEWLRKLYGNQLVSVVRHVDEPHWHLHAYILPEDTAMKASALHPGQLAKNHVMVTGNPEEDPKLLNKRGDAAYRQAMRAWQDSYHDAVASRCGLTRLGPGRRRLTRAEWQAERTQARALQATEARAAKLRKKVDAFIDQTKNETKAMVEEADAVVARARAEEESARRTAAESNADIDRRLEEATMATEAANSARKQALAEQQKAKTMMDRVREEASRVRATTVRLQKFPAFFRVIWDGFRKSRIQEHVQAAFQTELDSLRSVAAAWADRAGKAEALKRSAEERARSFERSLAETAAQRDLARKELERLRPAPSVPDGAFLPRPRPTSRK